MPFWLDLLALATKFSLLRPQSAKELMKVFGKMNVFLAVGVLWVGFALPLRATTIFDNSYNDLTNTFEPGTLEVGDEIILTNYPARYLTNFSFEYWGTNTANPYAFSGTVQARVRFYQNNGALFNGYTAPGTNFYDSGWFTVNPTPRSTWNFAGADFCTGLYLPVISNMTWSVQFRGMTGTDHVGVDLYSPSVVGQIIPDYWENDGGTWNLKTNSAGAGKIDFAAKMEASTAPAVSTSRPTLTSVASGSNLLFSWPCDHIGWKLQVQTNLTGGIITNGSNWYTITNSSTNNSWTLPIDRTKGSVFSRLINP